VTTSATSGPAATQTLRGSLLATDRPPKAGPLAASLAFAWRGLLKIKHVPDQLSTAIIFPNMFLLVFTFLLGGAIAGSTSDYLQFFLPGIVVLAAATTSVYTGITLNLDISKGIFDRFRSLPIWRPSILVGAMLADVVRYLIASVVTLLVGLLVGFRPGGGLVGVVLALLFLQVFAFSLSWLWTLFGVTMREPTAVEGMTYPLIFVLMFGSNLFAPPRTMPGWLEAVVNVNPISQAVTAVRGLMQGTATAGDMGRAFLACAVLVLVFAPPAVYLFNRKQR
jgi:ABC-2 type transport system permease protein